MTDEAPPPGSERRREPRHPVRIDVRCDAEGTHLVACITDISTMGIFIAATSPPPVGTRVALRFTPPTFARGAGRSAPIEALAEVMWTTDETGSRGHAGMGLRFVDLAPTMRTRIIELVSDITYLPG